MKACSLLLWSALAFTAFTAHAQNAPFIRGVTYFGNSSPTTFWNSNIQTAAEDFKVIQSDGFNAIVLVVPWGEFQPGVAPVRFNDEAFRRLNQVCSVAKAQGLRVFARVSYLWDFYPGVQMPDFQRASALLSNDTLLEPWKQYLQKIRQSTAGCASGYFTSWEDFWFLMEVASADPEASKAAADARARSFDAWALKHASKRFLAAHATTRQQTGLYPMPARESPDFRLILQWFDAQFTQRLMPAMARVLPQSSLEVRADDDPIFRDSKVVEWFSHKSTYMVPSSPYVMTYWAPAIGAGNRGDFEPAGKVLDRFIYMQEKIKASTTNKIFIDQFLFKDNSPEAERNTKIVPEQIPQFLKDVAAPLMKLTSGYALWGARDYHASLLFNGFFSLGTEGWSFDQAARLQTSGQGGSVARLEPGGTIAQDIPLLRGNAPGATQSTTVRFRTAGTGSLDVSYAGQTISVQVDQATATHTLQFPLAKTDSPFRILATSGTLEIADIYVYFFTHRSEVRDTEGKPSVHHADIVELNKRLANGAGIASRLSVEDNSMAQAAGVFPREQDGVRWYAWASPKVHASLFAKGSSITLRGYMKPSLFKASGPCVLDTFVDGKKVFTRTFGADEPLEVTVPHGKTVGSMLDVRLASSCSLAKESAGKPGGDSRDLSFILHEIRSDTVR